MHSDIKQKVQALLLMCIAMAFDASVRIEFRRRLNGRS